MTRPHHCEADRSRLTT